MSSQQGGTISSLIYILYDDFIVIWLTTFQQKVQGAAPKLKQNVMHDYSKSCVMLTITCVFKAYDTFKNVLKFHVLENLANRITYF